MERTFVDPGSRPTEAWVQTALGHAYPRYRRLVDRAAGLTAEWSFSRTATGGGWLLKVADRRKALFFVVPGQGGFLVRLTLRPAERDEFLADHDLAAAHPMIGSAPRYQEGCLLQFEVVDAADDDVLEAIVDRLIVLRAGGGRRPRPRPG